VLRDALEAPTCSGFHGVYGDSARHELNKAFEKALLPLWAAVPRVNAMHSLNISADAWKPIVLRELLFNVA
jgi:hypothetical protein